MHEQLAALSQGPIIKPKKKKEKKDKKEKKKKKKLEKRSRVARSRAGSEEWKMPSKILKSKSARAGGSQAKKAQGKKSNKNSKLVRVIITQNIMSFKGPTLGNTHFPNAFEQ